MKTYKSTVHYAHPTDPTMRLAPGEVFDADESDEEVQAAVRSGYFVTASRDDATAVFTSDQPDESWTNDRLRVYAEQKGIAVSASSTKAEMLAAIHEAGEGVGEPTS